MSAFKQLTTKDVTITPFDVSKEFSFTGTAMTASNVGVEVYLGQKSSFVKSLSNGLDNLATANNSLLSLYKPTVVIYV